jgi:hypothetical protein
MSFWNTINNTTENIKFTKEEEDNNQLAFLYILSTRTDDGTINTQVYRKKAHTDWILNFNSNDPTYMIPCRDCPQQYMGQTLKKIETRITEHKLKTP